MQNEYRVLIKFVDTQILLITSEAMHTWCLNSANLKKYFSIKIPIQVKISTVIHNLRKNDIFFNQGIKLSRTK